ncbi:MAG: M23 family metallopeptidase [Timaviella obliquedivisa GSE-PSE-MK23-08B]|jgi:murein DD-endopeptidase MepM/ murein hydrolase activator NlpD|nr:M23 family metallopeptidase [Timaviella obliquedivisa GSE-PSE-MK23-08B]
MGWAIVSPLRAIAQPSSGGTSAQPSASTCPTAALSRLTRHKIASGETLASIAQRYNLLSATLIGLNPVLRDGSLPIGTEISIPPYNGIRVEVPSGQTWRDVARTYNVRADLLFEVNGCQASPRVVFIPGVNWSPNQSVGNTTASSPLKGYPLPATAQILMNFGWQLDSPNSEVDYSNGVMLEAAAGTSVLAVGDGTVAFAGVQREYNGKLVVVNHEQGFQTRYALLGEVVVQAGQKVKQGDKLGTVAAAAQNSSSRLEFEVRTNSNLGWVAQDPGNYLSELRRERRR